MSRNFAIVLIVGLVAATVCGSAPTTVLLAAASSPPGASVQGDFNGDGIGDLAIGIPMEDVNGKTDAGAVQILYGTAHGRVMSALITQDTTGVADSAETGDQFGFAVAPAFVDGDQYADLVVGVPNEDLGAAVDAGAIHVLYGSATGITGSRSILRSQGAAAERGDRFGYSLAVGQFGRRALTDVAVGVPYEDLGSDVDAGMVQVLYDIGSGSAAPTDAVLSQDTTGIPGSTEKSDLFGLVLAAGDLGRTSQDDLAVGVPFEDLTGPDVDAGTVDVIYGSASGLTGVGSVAYSQGPPGLAAAEAGDRFGSALVIADFGPGWAANPPTGFADLAIGVPLEDITRSNGAGETTQNVDAGLVQIIYGTAGGLDSTSIRPTTLSQALGRTGIEAGDRFGASLAAADFGGTPDADLAVGVPGEDLLDRTTRELTVDAGGVHVFLGSSEGIGGLSSQFFCQDSLSVPGKSESGDRFGTSLAAGDLGGSSFSDLAIGVPGENLNGSRLPDAGIVHIFYGNPSGSMTEVFSTAYTQRVTAAGSGDPAEGGDQLGSRLAALDQG